MNAIPIITLTTDFGIADGYVASVKGVILSVNPALCIMDVCHEIGPQNIFHGAFVFHTAYSYFPDGTVHLVIIDPGVGSNRRAIIIKTKKQYFIGPDNGVFSFVLRDEHVEEIRAIENPKYILSNISSTFHGRDIFAPVGAHLASGIPMEEFGSVVDNPVSIPVPAPKYNNNLMVGHILCVDRFGNLITNIHRRFWQENIGNRRFIIFCGKRIEKLNRSYADSHVGEVLAIFNSSGYLEISVNYGNAAKEMGLDTGSEIEIDVL